MDETLEFRRPERLGRYTILGELGRGGMGVVYRAHDPQLDREVAIKVLPADAAANPDLLRRLKREAKLLAALKHPNVVTIHSVEDADGAHFLTMELVEGKALAELIPTGGMRIEELLALAMPLCDALSAAHGKGIVHRDVKPANIVLDEDGRVRLLDFGLATLRLEHLTSGTTQIAGVPITKDHHVLGTAPYMSPEQVKGQPVDQRSDIFSLGTVLYEIATGVRPFVGETSPELFASILGATPRPVDELRADVPPALGRIVARCVEKDPARRYRTVRDVRSALGDLSRDLRSKAIGASVTPGTGLAGWGWRRWLAIVCVVATAAIALLVLNLDRLPERPMGSGGRAAIRSIAVLPFDNLMNDPEQDYFVEGMHEALIADLSRTGNLRVISRTSAMRYKESGKLLPEIAEELDVDALVEGSVLRAERRVRISAKLILGATDEHLWAGSYERNYEHVLSILGEVASTIATSIEIVLTPAQQRRLATVQPVDPQVHEHYLKGRYSFNQLTAAGFQRAIEHYQQAIDMQPTYAAAHVGLATCHLLTAGLLGLGNRDESVLQAKTEALRALELDELVGDAHAVLGWIALNFERDWNAAHVEFQRELELNSNNTLALHGMGDYLTVVGRPVEGLSHVKRARQSDPMSPMTNLPVVGHLILTRRYDQAIEEGRTLLAFNDHSTLRRFVAQALWHQGRYDESLAEERSTWEDDPDLLEAAEQGYGESGPRGSLKAVARELAGREQPRPVGSLEIAGLFARGGDIDHAFEWLERAYEEKSPLLMFLRVNPEYDNLRSDPRLDGLAARVGIPD